MGILFSGIWLTIFIFLTALCGISGISLIVFTPHWAWGIVPTAIGVWALHMARKTHMWYQREKDDADESRYDEELAAVGQRKAREDGA